ncbi:MAG TPA: C25 family cysteine peptidase, partial [Candidatus Kapabacteria bacterium]|nr:C25 family cysteine peptidase [Candidatus Kapabacteria bacterium]
LPDVIVGRVTAVDLAEAEAYIKKVERYEADAASSAMWKNKSLFISGNQSLGSDFPAQITDLLNGSVPRNTFAERAGLNIDMPYYTEHDEVIKRFNDGLNYVQFMGHGGHRAWDDYVDGEGRAILIQDDVPLMNNPQGSYPFVTSLTCFTGSFEGEEPGLIPLLVNREGGGAIGGYATSSFGFRDADYRIAESLLPSVFDSTPATWGERIFRAKTEYYLKHGGFGMLVPQTLQYAYYFIGDPSVAPYSPTQQASVSLSTRTANEGASVTIDGETSVQSGTARIDLADEGNSPLPNGEHIIENVPVANGRFSVSDVIPSNLGTQAGTYRVTVTADDKSYARTSADISFAKDRITQVELVPRYLVPNAGFSISAAVQIAQSVSSVVAIVERYITDNAGNPSLAGTDNITLNRVGDRYIGTMTAPAASTRLEIAIEATIAGGGKIQSSKLSAIVGGSSDPAIYHLPNETAFRAKLIATPTGLAWQQRVYNLGSVEATRPRVELLATTKGVTSLLSSVTIPSIAPRSSVDVLMPVSSTTLDSAALRIRVVADTGSVPYNFIDSSSRNNESQLKFATLGAAAYLQAAGTTVAGPHSALSFDNGFVTLDLGANALHDVASTPIRVERVYQSLRNNQPDVQLIHLDSIAKLKTYAVRIVTDSLGAAALNQAASPRTLSIAVKDSRSNLAIYRQDDRSKLWTILPTMRNGNLLTATISHLGTFAVGYHTDKTPPVVELSVEGQVFVDKGDVPEKPRLSVVIQDANGIDVTTGKTVVTIDGLPVQSEITSSLDTQRTQTSINMRLEPTLSNGRHTISVLAVDNNGLETEKKLEVNVSNEFVIQELGVYPNPFATVMFIAYEIKGIPFADEVELNIYTVSGKLIKTHRFPSDNPEHTFGFVKGGTGTPTSLGYHEVWWDGRDNDGFDVANGVYYYRLKVETSRETKEITGKIARIR